MRKTYASFVYAGSVDCARCSTAFDIGERRVLEEQFAADQCSGRRYYHEPCWRAQLADPDVASVPRGSMETAYA